jgi:K+-sensing histidine kinase KdpD
MRNKLTGFKRLLQRIYTDRSIPEEDIESQRRVILLNIIFTIGIVTLVPYSVIAYKQGSFWLGIFDLVVSIILAGAYVYLRRSKNYTVTGYICISIVSLLVLYATSTGGHNNTGPLWSYTVPVFVLLLLGTKKGSIFMGIYFSIVLLILLLPGTPLLFTTYSRDFKVRYVTTFAVVYAIAFFAEWVRTKTQEKMVRKAKELEKTLEELEKTEAERNRLHDQLLTAEPKQITLEAENVTLKEDNDFDLKYGDYIKISITDNGRGIPKNQIGRIFDPYFSTKDSVTQKGLGLGLAICYSIIRKHNGHIVVKSEVGKGTTVELYLPVYKE